MEIVNVALNKIKPYERNPRKNDNAVKYVAESIKRFGFKVPLVLDKNNIIVCGHTRYKASKELGLKTVPCVYAEGLSEEQIRAYRLADNKVSEFSRWDFEKLDVEMAKIGDLGIYAFEKIEIDTEMDFSDFFEDAGEKKPKMVQCPHCGEWQAI